MNVETFYPGSGVFGAATPSITRTNSIAVHHLCLSREHNFFGHHGKPAGRSPMMELDQFECVAGRGIRGDRFFDYKENYKGQISFFSLEVFDALREELDLPNARPSATRRNAFVRGVDLNLLIGVEFEIQGVRFEGTEECRPCHWMDLALGPGAEMWLKGRGGLRARILSDGSFSAICDCQRCHSRGR